MIAPDPADRDTVGTHTLHTLATEGAARQRGVTNAEYIERLDAYAAKPTFDRLKKLFDKKYAEAAGRITEVSYREAVRAAREILVGTLADGNAEELKKLYECLRNTVRKNATHPFTSELISSLDENDAQQAMIKALMCGNPKEILPAALAAATAGTAYTTPQDQLALLTAIVALRPSITDPNNRKNGDAFDALCDKLLGTTDESAAAATAKQMVDLDDVGALLRRRARQDLSRISLPVWQAITANAQKEAVINLPLGVKLAFPVPTNAFEASASVLLGAHAVTAGKSREFLRVTDATVVKPHLLGELNRGLEQADALRDADISAQETAADGKIAALEARKAKGAWAFLSRQKITGWAFKDFAAARAARLESQKSVVTTQRDTLRNKAHANASAARVRHIKRSLRLAANLAAIHPPKVIFMPRHNARTAAQREMNRENLQAIAYRSMAVATPGELPAVVATVAQLIGGMPHYERAILASPETFGQLTSGSLPVDPVQVMQAMTQGIQRAPEALVGYMRALHGSGKLPAVVNSLVEAAKTDTSVRNNLRLYSQALGATFKALKQDASAKDPSVAAKDPEGFDQTAFAGLIGPTDRYERFLLGTQDGMNDWTRGQAAVRFAYRAGRTAWRTRLGFKRPAVVPKATLEAQAPTA